MDPEIDPDPGLYPDPRIRIKSIRIRNPGPGLKISGQYALSYLIVLVESFRERQLVFQVQVCHLE
jgi:hypothetical protein